MIRQIATWASRTRRAARRRSKARRGFAAVLIAPFAAGCALLAPLPEETSIEQRLAALPTADMPVAQPVTIRWDDHLVPFIEAESDRDLAVALGVVHAHLRLGQMEMMRRIADGRLSEMAGPLATEIDHGLRILNYRRGAERSAAALPAETRDWLQGFVDGIKHYQRVMTEPPHEYRVLGLAREPWTIEDVLTIGRLGSTDVNWIMWFRLLPLIQREDWPEIWAGLIEGATDSLPSFENNANLALLSDLLLGHTKAGSNSLVISGARSESGGAMIANDPHLGIYLPNLWLLAGIKSPSYHAVGMMIPGVPFIALGRNENIAWGGTNMRAASSDLYDVSALDPAEITERREMIKVRWWFDEEVTIRETPYGPIISDAPPLGVADGPPFALRWVGHEATDEVTAMLRVNRARNWDEFRAAFESFAVSAQNMLYADTDGNIGQVMAVRLPIRDYKTPDGLVLDPREERNLWRGFADATQLPASYNPAAGFLASANNRPVETAFPVGYFFSPDDRVGRMAELVRANGRIDLAHLESFQRDVTMPSAAPLRDAITAKANAIGINGDATPHQRKALDALAGWDGAHEADSAGALAFEVFVDAFGEAAHGPADAALFAVDAKGYSLLATRIAEADAGKIAGPLAEALETAGEAVAEHGSWGEMHRMALTHPLANLPVIGGKYRFAEWPVGGGKQTLMKTSHRAAKEKHDTAFGSQSRHVSDMADPDANWFALLGGQDGRIGSPAFMDQAELWRRGDYVQLPLRPETVRAAFPHETVLRPVAP
ncbi:MAG: penicillin acylase family protein [Proteobacteria bacterium]|nr:penicillin acylase family protein [Pseudomonadota bacterium]